MAKHRPERTAPDFGICPVTGESVPDSDLVPLEALRPPLVAMIRRDYPALDGKARISPGAIDRYRLQYVQDLLRQERGELTQLDEEVTRSLAEGAVISANVEEGYAEARTFGERLSDRMASFGGSWPFLILFAVFLAVWVGINVAWAARAFDPYPYILLNLILSCIAAVQAPIIMMSQRRQEAKDRLRSLNDYKVNLKAELEIRHLHEKIDHLISKQWQRLAEIQELQIELLQERRGNGGNGPGGKA